MRWQMPFIIAYRITTHKSQSVTAHNSIVYEPSKQTPFTPNFAISRATDLDKVTLLSPIKKIHNAHKFKTDNDAIA